MSRSWSFAPIVASSCHGASDGAGGDTPDRPSHWLCHRTVTKGPYSEGCGLARNRAAAAAGPAAPGAPGASGASGEQRADAGGGGEPDRPLEEPAVPDREGQHGVDVSSTCTAPTTSGRTRSTEPNSPNN